MAEQTKSKEYIRPMPPNWWMHNRHLLLFVLREISAVFIGIYAVFLLVMLYLANKPEPFAQFYQILKSPIMMAFHVIVLVFALVHSITFFNLTPKVLVIRQGEERIPDVVIAGIHYVAWMVVSILLIVVVVVV